MASIASRRLAKELSEIKAEGCPVGINLVQADDFQLWKFSIEVMGESLYQAGPFPKQGAQKAAVRHPFKGSGGDVISADGSQGEVFTLQFRFDPQYPISSPAVQYVGEAPLHPHIYSNGHAGYILYNEIDIEHILRFVPPFWEMNGLQFYRLSRSVLQCRKKERPVDNDRYVRTAPDNPKKTLFHYDDDTV